MTVLQLLVNTIPTVLNAELIAYAFFQHTNSVSNFFSLQKCYCFCSIPDYSKGEIPEFCRITSNYLLEFIISSKLVLLFLFSPKSKNAYWAKKAWIIWKRKVFETRVQECEPVRN